ncbi:MAG: hypothetical protein ACLFRT_13380 [Actinomycetota bacterium]
MTATIKPPEKDRSERRGLRFSSMEVLGFAYSESMWSDAAPASIVPETVRRGRHEATVADLRPEDPGDRFTGGNVRWGFVAMILLLVTGAAAAGLWLYQRPAAHEAASVATLISEASQLESGLPTLEQFNIDLVAADIPAETSGLASLEATARSLFAASADLGSGQTEMRTAASQASGSTLDAIRLATEARSYQAAVLPVLTPPELETDPELIELDEAARQFGDWQLGFDDVRTALPEAILSDVTQELDILSGDLSTLLGRYVDALREDDPAAVEAVMSDLSERLAAVDALLQSELEEIRARVETRVGEARQALDRILTR